MSHPDIVTAGFGVVPTVLGPENQFHQECDQNIDIKPPTFISANR